MAEIYNENGSAILLGILCNDCNKCLDNKYILESNDFKPILLHQIVFGVCKNLAIKGAKSIDIIEIEEFLKNYEAQFNSYKDNNGSEFINTIKQLGEDSKDNIDYYYNNVRKHSLLREYKNNGFEIKEIWDCDKSIDSNENELDKWTIEDICNYFEKKQVSIRKEFNINNQYTEMICGDGFDELLDELQEEPMWGGCLSSPMLTELYRGWCKGHLILRGAPSSFGKTMLGLADQVNVSCKKIWSEKNNDFIDNPFYCGMGAYLHSEQKSREEIQTRACSIIAKIPYRTVLDGDYTKDEKERLHEAGIISKESQFKLINYPNFTSSGLREVVKELSLQGYEYITQDYIWNNSWIVSDMKKTMGLTNISEPNALLNFANAQKIIAEDFNVAMATMMQLNGKEKEVDLVDEGCLYASRAVKTKLDNGSIIMSPKQKELKQTESYILGWNKKHNPNSFGGIIYPNAVSHCFKTRYGSYGQNIKIFHYIDFSNGKVIDMFATNWDNTPLKDHNGKIINLPNKLEIKRNN